MSAPLGRGSPVYPTGTVHRLSVIDIIKGLGLPDAPLELELPRPSSVAVQKLSSTKPQTAYLCPVGAQVYAPFGESLADVCKITGQISLDEMPLTGPQPAPVGCPACDIRILSATEVQLRLDPSAPAGSPQVSMLEIENHTTSRISRIRLPDIGPTSSGLPSHIRVQLPSTVVATDPSTMRVILWDDLSNRTSASELHQQ
ncbi:MAG: hypothetical protein AAFN74_17400 [Myxococcota bacterium]